MIRFRIFLIGSFLCAALSQSSAASVRIDSSLFGNHMDGKELTVCGTLAEVKKISNGVFLNLGDVFPRQDVSVVIQGNVLGAVSKKFGRIDKYIGKKFCATGTPQISRSGQPQLPVLNPTLLRLMK